MRNIIVTFILLCVSAALFSLPAVYYLDSVAVGGAQSDVWGNLWLNWATTVSVFEQGISLADFPLLVGAESRNLWAHLDGVLLPAVLAPVAKIGGPVRAANLALIVILFCNGLFAYLFLRMLVGDHSAALPPALAFAVSTVVLADVSAGKLAETGVFVLPLAAMAVVRVCDSPSWRTAGMALAGLLIAGLWHIQFGLAVFLFSIIAAVWASIEQRKPYPAWAVFGALAAVVLLLLPFLIARHHALAAIAHPGGWLGAEGRLYLPYFILILALAGLIRHPKQAGFWWLSALVMFLSMWAPGVENKVCAGGFLNMAILCLAVPAGQFLRYLLEYFEARTPGNEGKVAAMAVLLALGVSFFQVPHPAVATQVPDAYGAFHEYEEGGVLELPVHSDIHINARYLFYQHLHRRPVLVGQSFPAMSAGLPSSILLAAPELSPLNTYPPDMIGLTTVDGEKLRAGLRELEIRYLAVHPNDLPVDIRQLFGVWCDQTFGAPLRRSKAVVVYGVW